MIETLVDRDGGNSEGGMKWREVKTALESGEACDVCRLYFQRAAMCVTTAESGQRQLSLTRQQH